MITVPLPRSSIPGSAAWVSTSGAVTFNLCTVFEVVRFDPPHGARPAPAARVVHQHIQPPKLSLRPRHHLARGFRISDVGRDCQRLAARIPNYGRRLIKQPLPPPNQRHPRAFFRQRNRTRPPNPRPSPRNQRGLTTPTVSSAHLPSTAAEISASAHAELRRHVCRLATPTSPSSSTSITPIMSPTNCTHVPPRCHPCVSSNNRGSPPRVACPAPLTYPSPAQCCAGP